MKGSERADLIAYRLNRATETLSEIEIHVNNGLWNTAINRLYYACYYAASTLLLANDIKASTHSGVRQMLGLHFIKTGNISSELGKVSVISLIRDMPVITMILFQYHVKT